VGPLNLAVDLGWDDGFRTHRFDRSHDGAGVVAAVGQYGFSSSAGQQRQGFGELSGLAAGKPKANGLSQAVGQQVDFGDQSTSGTP